MRTANEELKSYAKERKIFLWMIADAENVSEFTIIRRWRHELSEQETTRYKKIIDMLAKEKG